MFINQTRFEMPSKKEKQALAAALKAQTAPLANSTNTTPSTPNTNQTVPSTNSHQTVTTHLVNTITTKKSNLSNGTSTNIDRLALIRDQKHELDELNNRFSSYVDALRKKTKENDDLQKKVDNEKQKFNNQNVRNSSALETKMEEVRNDIDESAVLTEHFNLKRNRALKEVALLKDKIRLEEERSFTNRRQQLENDYQQSLNQLKDLTRRCEDLERLSKSNQNELNQMNDMYKKLEDELHDLILNNIRLECNLRTIEEKTLLTKAVYETEKNDFASEQLKQQQFYTDELDKAIGDIKRDFQVLLQNNKVILENAYTERIEQVKTQITTYEANRQKEVPLASTRVSVENIQEELKEAEKARNDIENEYRPLIDSYLLKQKEKNQIDEERFRLDNEYNRLINEINNLTEAIEIGKQYWFSVHFELETYRRLLDLESNKTTKTTIIDVKQQTSLPNGKNEEEEEEGTHNEVEQQAPQQVITVKKTDTQQRSISKTGKFDIDQVQAGFISINNAANNCVDQPLKGWSLSRSINEQQETTFQFPDAYILKARTRVRVYSNKAVDTGNSSTVQGRLVATAIPAWASTGQGENVKIILFDEKGINRAQYTETWQ